MTLLLLMLAQTIPQCIRAHSVIGIPRGAAGADLLFHNSQVGHEVRRMRFCEAKNAGCLSGRELPIATSHSMSKT